MTITGFIRFVPWLLCAATAVWFALMAREAGRSPVSWGLAGAIFGLVASTIVIGLGHATTIPFSDRDRTVASLEWAVVAVLIIAVLGWLITLSLHRQHVALLHRMKKTPPPPAKPAAPGAPAARPEPPKPPHRP